MKLIRKVASPHVKSLKMLKYLIKVDFLIMAVIVTTNSIWQTENMCYNKNRNKEPQKWSPLSYIL